MEKEGRAGELRTWWIRLNFSSSEKTLLAWRTPSTSRKMSVVIGSSGGLAYPPIRCDEPLREKGRKEGERPAAIA
eukprot:scaffold297410_cov30-Tisochrysis_lutea.AAC.2